MPDISIDRMSVVIPSGLCGDAALLARAIGERLAAVAGGAGATEHRESIHIAVPAGPPREVHVLADLIVADLVRQLNLSS